MLQTILITLLTVSNIHMISIRETLKKLESNCNTKAIDNSKSSFGVLQIKNIVIDDVNRIYGTNYKHKDSFNEKKSNEIFCYYIEKGVSKFKKTHNKNPLEQDIVRMWNGGAYSGYSKKSTLKYYEKYLEIKSGLKK